MRPVEDTAEAQSEITRRTRVGHDGYIMSSILWRLPFTSSHVGEPVERLVDGELLGQRGADAHGHRTNDLAPTPFARSKSG